MCGQGGYARDPRSCIQKTLGINEGLIAQGQVNQPSGPGQLFPLSQSYAFVAEVKANKRYGGRAKLLGQEDASISISEPSEIIKAPRRPALSCAYYIL